MTAVVRTFYDDNNRVLKLISMTIVTMLTHAGGVYRVPASALPLGAEPVTNPLRVQSVQWSREMINSVLGVSHAKDQVTTLTNAGRSSQQRTTLPITTLVRLGQNAGASEYQ
jgi:hypothetical protein